MLRMGAPGRDRFVITPPRQREVSSLIAQTLEAFDRDEAIDLRELGSQRRGQVEIRLCARRLHFHFENYGNHA